MRVTSRISRSTGATSKTGSKRVVSRKVAHDASRRSFTTSRVGFVGNTDPMCAYSCAKSIASSRCCSPWTKCVQNARIDAGEVRSQCSAYMFSLFVVLRSTGTNNAADVAGAPSDRSTGSGESAIRCAPRRARESRSVRPIGVNAPYHLWYNLAQFLIRWQDTHSYNDGTTM